MMRLSQDKTGWYKAWTANMDVNNPSKMHFQVSSRMLHTCASEPHFRKSPGQCCLRKLLPWALLCFGASTYDIPLLTSLAHV